MFFRFLRIVLLRWVIPPPNGSYCRNQQNPHGFCRNSVEIVHVMILSSPIYFCRRPMADRTAWKFRSWKILLQNISAGPSTAQPLLFLQKSRFLVILAFCRTLQNPAESCRFCRILQNSAESELRKRLLARQWWPNVQMLTVRFLLCFLNFSNVAAAASHTQRRVLCKSPKTGNFLQN